MGQVNIRVPDDKVESVRARLKDMAASLGISQGELLERALDSVSGSTSPADLAQKTYERAGRIEGMVEELLELGAPVPNPSMPTESVPASEFRTPTSIPGVVHGAQNLRPVRESGSERAARERRERQNRASALDNSAGERDDIDRSDEYVSG